MLFNFEQVLNLSTAPLLALHCSGSPSTISHLWSLSLWHWLGAQRPQLQCPDVHRLLHSVRKKRVLFSMDASPELSPSSLFPPFCLWCVLSLQAPRPGACGSGSPALIAGVAPHRRVWPVVHGGGALSPLLPLLFPQLPLLTVRILATLP